MEIKVQSIKFDADQKLLDFIDNKVGKILSTTRISCVPESTSHCLQTHKTKM